MKYILFLKRIKKKILRGFQLITELGQLPKSLYLIYFYPFFSKKQVTCPICSWSAIKFIDFNLGNNHYYRNAECPKCGSHGRHRTLYFFLKEYFFNHSAKNLSVLHVSPEKGIEQFLKSHKNIDYLSIDLDSPYVMKHENLEKLTMKSRSFSLVICFHVLEHVSNDLKALREIYRVLKKGGIAVLDVPIDRNRKKTFEDSSITNPQERLKFFGQEDHVRIYGTDFTERIKQAGFDVSTFQITNSKMKKQFGLHPYPLFIAKKF